MLELLPEKSLAIIAAAPVKMMTDVVPYTFRQDADYSYITGCQQPGGVAVLGHDIGLCMFMPEPKPYVSHNYLNIYLVIDKYLFFWIPYRISIVVHVRVTESTVHEFGPWVIFLAISYRVTRYEVSN